MRQTEQVSDARSVDKIVDVDLAPHGGSLHP
jgi:hypothetical protein